MPKAGDKKKKSGRKVSIIYPNYWIREWSEKTRKKTYKKRTQISHIKNM